MKSQKPGTHVLCGVALFLAPGSWLPAADLRVGIIGTDTSHSEVFTRILNDPNDKEHVPGVKVVAAFKGGSPDIQESASRVDKYAQTIHDKYGVEIVNSIPELCQKVDVVLLESVDGRAHLNQVKPVLAAKKRVFIDKPLASSYADAKEIARLAKQANVPWFSSSALRFGEIAMTMKYPDATGIITWGPSPLEAHHQLELSWYGIHPVEMLFTMMGRGCEEVTDMSTAASDEITCRWKAGRLGTVRGLRPYSEYGAVVFRPKEIVQSPAKAKFSYQPLLQQIVHFFETGQPPVPNDETMEIFAFMDAAQRSKAAGGKPMKLLQP